MNFKFYLYMYVCEIIIELIHFNIIRGNITIYYVLEEDVGEKKTVSQKYGDSSIDQWNEWWERLERVINVTKGKRREWGIVIIHDRKCLCIIISLCATKISCLRRYIGLLKRAGMRVSMRSKILMLLVSNYLVCNYLYVIKLASRQSAAFYKRNSR